MAPTWSAKAVSRTSRGRCLTKDSNNINMKSFVKLISMVLPCGVNVSTGAKRRLRIAEQKIYVILFVKGGVW
jgi:hypothetical protein